jgi:hypothetical protein
MERAKLFHTLVAMGVALTGGTLVEACGGSENTPTSTGCDPKTDVGCTYGNISPAGGDAYANIGYVQQDASGDQVYYADIHAPDSSRDDDAYANISPPPPPSPDPG